MPQGSKQLHHLIGQQLPKVATDPGGGAEQRGGPRPGARGSMPTAASPAVEQLLLQEQSGLRLSGQGTGPTAFNRELSLLSAGDDESSLSQPCTSAAAAEAASAKQLVSEMQAHIAALHMEKAQLSALLSAAHSSMQQLKDADALGTERTIMLGQAAEEAARQQRQLASEETQVE